MTKSLHRIWIALLLTALCGSLAKGQQQLPQQQLQPPQQPLLGQQGQPLPPEFQLNAMQQAYLEQVLNSWQQESAKVTIFQCAFERWEYNKAFGPGNDLPLNKNKGELSYQKPDKGSFQITEVSVWQAAQPPANGAQPGQANGNWVVQKDAIGEHWVCDGESVYEYSHRQKKLIVRPIPPQLRGKAIVDGPLPFLFGAEAAKLKARYWLRAEQNQQDPNTIFISALPRFANDAADYRQVDVMLDRTKMMPKAMQVHMPNGDRHVYMFDITNATVNEILQRVMALFQAPRTPWGWERVVEAAPPEQPPAMSPVGRQAAQPDALSR
jgi:TIGR03009 family protein